MDQRLYFVKELFYGAGLFTVITAAPEIVVTLEITRERVSSLSFSYPNIVSYMIGSLLFTAAVLLTRKFRCHFLILGAWMVLCCVKFLRNCKLQTTAIKEMSIYGRPLGPMTALVVYCIIFTFAVELMLHWVAISKMMPAQIVVNIEVYRGLRQDVRQIRG